MGKIAFLGMGAMGSRMAARLLGAGHALTVWNRNPDRCGPLVEQGAVLAGTPLEAATGAEFVFSMVRDDPASREVWLHPTTGALGGLSAHAVGLECSSVSPEWARTLAKHASDAGRVLLDAPVAGSRPQVEAGQLIWLVGGDADALARVRPLLELLGTVQYAGDSGAGAVMKMAVNTLLAIQVAAAAELLGMVSRSGIDLAKAVAILAATPVCSPALKAAAGGMVARQFAPLFPVELIEKDLGYAIADAKGAMPVAAAARGVFDEALSRGFGDDNMTKVAALYSGG
jgi:3-hydroxyisobutyrate dehydrogenase